MAITKTSSTQIGSWTNQGSDPVSSSIFDVSDAVACEIEVVMSNASAVPDPSQGSIDIEVYECSDGTSGTAGDDPIFTGSTLPDAQSWRAHFPMNVIASKYILVVLKNNLKDSGGSAISADFTINTIKTTV